MTRTKDVDLHSMPRLWSSADSRPSPNLLQKMNRRKPMAGFRLHFDRYKPEKLPGVPSSSVNRFVFSYLSDSLDTARSTSRLAGF